MLGLTRRNQVRLVPNTASTRGALDKVKHLVTIEAEADHQARAAVALDRLEPASSPPSALHIRGGPRARGGRGRGERMAELTPRARS